LKQRGRALSSQTQHLTVLRPRGYPHDRSAVDSGNFNLGAKCRFNKGYRDGALQVVSGSLEKGMWSDVRNDIEITARPSVFAGIAMVRKADTRS
jgi:hypothetical protein